MTLIQAVAKNKLERSAAEAPAKVAAPVKETPTCFTPELKVGAAPCLCPYARSSYLVRC